MADEADKGGRPLKFKSAKELQGKIDEYFESCQDEWWVQVQNEEGKYEWVPRLDRNGQIIMRQVRPYTITGLALHLGTTRETLLDYESKMEYSDTIKRAKTKIENYTEEQLFNPDAKNMTGIIFNLKNNYKRWTDKQELEHNGDLNIKVGLPEGFGVNDND